MTCNMASDPLILSTQYGFLIPFTTSLVSLIELFGLFHVLRASGFDADMSRVAFK